MNGLPHYFLIGLIISYVYLLLLGSQVMELNKGFMEITGAYLGWLTSETAKSKEMAFVIVVLVASLFIVMVIQPDNLPSIVGLITFISVGWFGSLTNRIN
jgi:cell division protein FtsW (lipid II flippase)